MTDFDLVFRFIVGSSALAYLLLISRSTGLKRSDFVGKFACQANMYPLVADHAAIFSVMVKPLFAVVPVEMWAGVSLVRHILRPLCYPNHGRRRAARGGIQS